MGGIFLKDREAAFNGHEKGRLAHSQEAHMSKPMLGLALGAALGFIDGVSAYAYPYEDVRSQIIGVVIGSTFKGLITGVLAGFLALKYRSLPLGIAFGLVVGLILSWLVALGNHYYLEIMLPGSLLGAIVGFATQRFGRQPARAAS